MEAFKLSIFTKGRECHMSYIDQVSKSLETITSKEQMLGKGLNIPNNATCFCYQSITFQAFLNKLQVTMPGIIHFDITNLGIHPVSIRQTRTNTFTHQKIQVD